MSQRTRALRTIASAASMLQKVSAFRSFAIGADAMATAVMPRAERPGTLPLPFYQLQPLLLTRTRWLDLDLHDRPGSLLGWAAAGIAALALRASIAHVVD